MLITMSLRRLLTSGSRGGAASINSPHCCSGTNQPVINEASVIFVSTDPLLTKSHMKTRVLLSILAALPLAVFGADVSGTWKSDFDSQIGHQNYTFTFKQDGTKLTGKAHSEVGDRK